MACRLDRMSGLQLQTGSALRRAMWLLYAKLNSRMQTGWIRTFVLIAVAALVGNAQCYGTCGSSACGSAQTPSNSCHHQKSSHDDAHCPHQHSELAGPEVGIAKINLAMAPLTLPVLTADSTEFFTEPQVLSQLNTGSPPGRDICSTISVIRI